MKKLSKNTFAKLFATFLGASTILTPLVTIVSCQPISKSPTIEQQNSNSNKNNNGNGSGTGNTQPGNGSGTGNTQPGNGSGTGNTQPGNGSGTGNTQPGNGGGTETPKPNAEETQIGSTIDNTAIIVKNNNSEYSIKGSIYIDNIGKLEAELDSLTELNGKTINTSALNIDCFETKKEQISGQSITTRNTKNQAITYISKKITPDILKKVLELKKSRNFTTLTLNNNGTISIPFESTIEKPFNISDLAKFSFSKDFKLTENSELVLGGLPLQEDETENDKAKYVTIDELVRVIKQKHFKNFKIKNIGLRGNIKTILPYLTDGTFQGKEIEGKGVEFAHSWRYSCDEGYFTGYQGSGKNDILTLNQVKEISKRYPYNGARLQNVTLTGINTKNIQEGELDGIIKTSSLDNIIFKDSDLSKVVMESINSLGYLKFENTILPQAIPGSTFQKLILKNATLPEELKTTPLKKILDRFPTEIGTLKIYNLQGRFLDKYTEEEIKQVKKQWQNYGNMPGGVPSRYAGPQDVWNKLKLLLQEGKTTKTHFTNEDLTDVDNNNINFSAIQKPQDTFLALLGNNNSRG